MSRITRRSLLNAAVTLPLVGVPLVGVPLAWTLPAQAQGATLPIVFVHGNGDTAGLWITTLWRFESNGYPRELMFAVDLKNPSAQAVDGTEMPGRSSSADVMRQLADEVTAVMASTGAPKVVLVAQSRGGNTVRNYIKNGGGAERTALAVICGAVNHGVVVSEKFLVGSEFNGASTFMRDLNSTPGEIVAGVRFVTIRSADNDKFAQPDGKYLGQAGTATGVGFAGPELAGAENIVLPKLDHRETGYAPEAFAAIYKAVTGKAPSTIEIVPEAQPLLNGKVSSFEAGSPTNIGVAGATVTVYATAPADGSRQGEAVHHKTTGADGLWGPFQASADQRYEFVVEVPGQPITHIYRSAFLRSTKVLHLRPQLLGKGDAEAARVVYLQRPRGYFGVGRDVVELGGKPAAGIPEGVPSVSTSKVLMSENAEERIVGRCNTEIIAARGWPMKDNHVTVIELTY
jgi:triacylglycerol lipase